METQQQLIIKDSLSVSDFSNLMFLAVVNRSEELPLKCYKVQRTHETLPRNPQNQFVRIPLPQKREERSGHLISDMLRLPS